MYKNTPRGRFRAQLLGPACPHFFVVPDYGGRKDDQSDLPRINAAKSHSSAHEPICVLGAVSVVH
jgi:hypothetical protein